MENRRIVLAIALVLFVWSGFNMLFPREDKNLEEKQNISETINVKEISSPEIVFAPITDSAPVSVGIIEEKNIKVYSDLFELNFNTSGARLVEAQLFNFKQQNTPDSPFVKIVDVKTAEFGTYGISGGDGFNLPEDIIYTSAVDELSLSNTEKTDLVFQATTPDNTKITKIFTFYPNKYYFDINVFIENFSNTIKRGTIKFSIVNQWDDKKAGDRYSFVGPTSFNGEDLLNNEVEDLKESNKSYGSKILWTAYETKYFTNIVKPFDNSLNSLNIHIKNDAIFNTLISEKTIFEKNKQSSFKYTGYLGPMDMELLKEPGLSFERIIDLGFFDIIAKPLKIALNFFYGYLGNYGFAIVLLTVCIKAIFWPLTQKSYSSMKNMQKLQPQMAKLRAKHGKDKQKLNQEMMALYKENRVNPFGGCLPILVQIPVFFALYQVLLGGIELRHAPFMLWITDLSAADTLISDALGLGFALGPLPVIMGFTMFLQQKMAPTNMDPMQAKIMLFMPVFFTFIFLSFPSGLVVYWLINNLLTIAQQYLINREPA